MAVAGTPIWFVQVCMRECTRHEIIANYCNENSLSNQNVPSPRMIRVYMQGCTVFCRCYDQATLADFVYFRWLFYSLGGCVGSVGSLWYTFRYPCHQDWSDLSTWTRFLQLFKTFFLFVIVAVRKNRLRLKNPGSFFWQLFLQKICIKFLRSLRVDLVNFWCQNSFLRFSPEIKAWGRKGPWFGIIFFEIYCKN